MTAATIPDATLEHLRETRSRTLALVAALRAQHYTVPLLEHINPLLWELGHIAYFAEFWTLRHLYGDAPLLPEGDRLYDSAKIPHDARWTLPLPSREETFAFLASELEALARHAREGTPAAHDPRYFHTLAAYHEDMHGEALTYTLQTLGYERPHLPVRPAPQGGPLPGDVRVPGGRYRIGSLPADGFVFDNEQWSHEVEVASFAIARAPVTNEAYAAFVEDGGYRTERYWSPAGWAWRSAAGAEHPVYWSPAGSGRGAAAWLQRHFDTQLPLQPHAPVSHVNWYEAQAYCAWAGRRLPTEAEWEVAATGGTHRRYPWGEDLPSPERANLDFAYGGTVDVGAFPQNESPAGCRQMLGNVWEWTSSVFLPYPGFAPGPYKEYSEPWLGTHFVLRGGAWSTRARLATTRWRNFYRPHRRDIITGFRTCAR